MKKINSRNVISIIGVISSSPLSGRLRAGMTSPSSSSTMWSDIFRFPLRYSVPAIEWDSTSSSS